MASKTEEAYARLRRDILDCRLPPDEPLTIAALRTQTGLGWTPLREALARLEAEGLVTSALHRGYRVAPVRVEDLIDLQNTRLLIEGELLALSIRHGDTAWESRLVGAHHGLSRAERPHALAPPEAVEAWEHAHSTFHVALGDGAVAPWLKRFAAELRDAIHRHQRFILMDVSPAVADHVEAALARTTAIDHHTLLMQAAIDRDEARARTLMAEHIGFTLAVYRAVRGEA